MSMEQGETSFSSLSHPTAAAWPSSAVSSGPGHTRQYAFGPRAKGGATTSGGWGEAEGVQKDHLPSLALDDVPSPDRAKSWAGHRYPSGAWPDPSGLVPQPAPQGKGPPFPRGAKPRKDRLERGTEWERVPQELGASHTVRLCGLSRRKPGREGGWMAGDWTGEAQGAS